MKKFDIIIIVSFALIAAISAAWFMFSLNKKFQTRYAEIYVQGILYKRVQLTNNMPDQTIPVETKLGKNIIHISEGKINIIDADCPDKVCIKSGYIDKPGQTLVCLPHKLVVEIKGESKLETDELAY